MTDKELLDKAIYWFKVIADDMERITSGNLPHNAAITKGRAIRAYEFLEKHRQEEPVSEELEEAAWLYYDKNRLPIPPDWDLHKEFIDSFKAGAMWQKEQMMAKAFDFTKEHNTACILASECLRNHGWFGRERDFNDLFRHLSCVDKLFEGKFCGKTKVIVIKED